MLNAPVRNLLRKLALPSSESGAVMIGGKEMSFTILRKKRRKRTIAFTVDADRTIRVLAPMRTSFSFVQTMLQKRSDVVLRRLHSLEAMGSVQTGPRFAQDDIIRYLGHDYRLRVTQDEKRLQGCRIWPRRFEVNIADTALSDQALRDKVRTEIRLWMKKRAKVKLHERLDYWAGIMGVKYQKLMLTEPEWQWGSCSSQNVIRLNWRLIMAPLSLLDYVVAHELCHVKHKNHSPRFWGMLEDFMPDCMARRKQLRQPGHGLV